MIKSILSVMMIVFILNGCNTIAGMGEDIESAGENIKNTANQEKQNKD